MDEKQKIEQIPQDPMKPPVIGEKLEDQSIESHKKVNSEIVEPQKPTSSSTTTRSSAKSPVPKIVSQKSETLEKIEDVMEEDIEEMYASLPEDVKKEFKEKGEETAEEIEGMLYKVKIKSSKIFKLLFGWLKIIPGVNKYFLQQEAKLKTDEILHIKEEVERQRGQTIQKE